MAFRTVSGAVSLTLLAGTCAGVPATGPALAQTPPQAGPALVRAVPWPPEVEPDAERVVTALMRMATRDTMEEGRIHVETLMTALGALAGFAAQEAIRDTVVATGKLPLHGVGKDLDGGAFVVVAGPDGKPYFFGNLLNSYLAPQPPLPNSPPPTSTLYALVAGAVASKGGIPLPRDELGAIFKRTAKSVGTPDFGKPSLGPDHLPHRLPREELERLWPKAVAIFRDKPADGKGRPLDPAYWPMAVGVAAQRLIPLVANALPPATSMRVFFEAAVPMSKVDPASLPAGPAPQPPPPVSPSKAR